MATLAPEKIELVAETSMVQPPLESPAIFDEVNDDRNRIHNGDKVLLIVDNDLGFARFIVRRHLPLWFLLSARLISASVAENPVTYLLFWKRWKVMIFEKHFLSLPNESG